MTWKTTCYGTPEAGGDQWSMPDVVRAGTDLELWGTGLQILGKVESKTQPRTREEGTDLSWVLYWRLVLIRNYSLKFFFKK